MNVTQNLKNNWQFQITKPISLKKSKLYKTIKFYNPIPKHTQEENSITLPITKAYNTIKELL